MAGFPEGIKVFFGGDTTQLKASLQEAETAVGRFATQVAKKFEGRDLARGLATAFGLSVDKIADRFARFWTGMTKDAEATYGRLEQLSDDYTEKLIAFQTSRLSDQKQYELALVNIAQLEDKIAKNRGATEQEQVSLLQDKIRLLDRQKEAERLIEKIQKDTAAENTKRWEEDLKFFGMATKFKKEVAAEEKQRAKDAFAADLDWYKERARLEKSLRDLKLQAMKPEEQEAAINKEITDWKRQQLSLDKDSNEWMALEQKILEANLTIEEKITAQKERQRVTAEKAAKIELAAQSAKTLGISGGLTAKELAQLDEYVRSEGKKGSLPTRTGGQLATSGAFSNESDETLAEVIRRGKQEIAKLSSAYGVFGIGADIRRTQLQSTVGAAELEANARRKLSLDFSVGGEGMARRNFAGDPTAFERFFDQQIKGQNTLEKILQAQDTTIKILRTGIPTIPLDGGRG